MGFGNFLKHMLGRKEQPEPLLSKQELFEKSMIASMKRVEERPVVAAQRKWAQQERDDRSRESAAQKVKLINEQVPAPSATLASKLTPQASRGVERRRVDYIAHLQQVVRDKQNSPARDSYKDLPSRSPKGPSL